MGRLFDVPDEPPARPRTRRPRSCRWRRGCGRATLEEFVGQQHLLGQQSALRTAIQSGEPHSMILYGPPGTGKTTLARMLAEYADAAFEELSAVEAGRAEVREVMARARERRRGGRHTIFFLDEIHRFNKAQQDALLPAVEEGLVVLVGATTENPYFEVNSALISRTQIYELQRADAGGHRRAAAAGAGRGRSASVDDEVIEFLAARSGGDARTSLNALELALDTAARTGERRDAGRRRGRDAAQGAALRQGAATSTTTTSRPGSSPRAARTPTRRCTTSRRCSRAARTPRFIARRMVILASEDVGNADPQALQVAVAAAHAVEHVGLPEAHVRARPGGDLPLAGAEVQRRRAARSAPRARTSARHGAAARRRRCARRPTRRRGRSAAGIGYDYPHDHPGQVNDQEHLPAGRRAPALLRPRRRRAGAARAARPDPGGPGAVTPELAAQPLWSLVPVASRARYIRRTAVAMLDELDDLARLLAEETGWPREHVVLSELLPAARGLHTLADLGPRALADRRVIPRAAWLAGPQHAARALARRRRRAARPVGLTVVRAGARDRGVAAGRQRRAARRGRRRRRLRGVFLRAGVPGELWTVVAERRPPRRTRLPARRRAPAAEPARHAARARGRAARRRWSRRRCGRRSAATPRPPGGSSRSRAPCPASSRRSSRAPRRLAETIGPPEVVAVAARRPALRRPPPGRRSRSSRRPTPTPRSASPHAAAATPRSPSGRAIRAKGERVARRLPSPATWVGHYGEERPNVEARLARHAVLRQLEWRAPLGAAGSARRRDPRRARRAATRARVAPLASAAGSGQGEPAQAVSDGPLRTDHSPLRTHPSAWTQGPPCHAFSFSPRAARNGEMSKGTRQSMQRMSEAAAPASP